MVWGSGLGLNWDWGNVTTPKCKAGTRGAPATRQSEFIGA